MKAGTSKGETDERERCIGFWSAAGAGNNNTRVCSGISVVKVKAESELEEISDEFNGLRVVIVDEFADSNSQKGRPPPSQQRNKLPSTLDQMFSRRQNNSNARNQQDQDAHNQENVADASEPSAAQNTVEHRQAYNNNNHSNRYPPLAKDNSIRTFDPLATSSSSQKRRSSQPLGDERFKDPTATIEAFKAGVTHQATQAKQFTTTMYSESFSFARVMAHDLTTGTVLYSMRDFANDWYDAQLKLAQSVADEVKKKNE